MAVLVWDIARISVECENVSWDIASTDFNLFKGIRTYRCSASEAKREIWLLRSLANGKEINIELSWVSLLRIVALRQLPPILVKIDEKQ